MFKSCEREKQGKNWYPSGWVHHPMKFLHRHFYTYVKWFLITLYAETFWSLEKSSAPSRDTTEGRAGAHLFPDRRWVRSEYKKVVEKNSAFIDMHAIVTCHIRWFPNRGLIEGRAGSWCCDTTSCTSSSPTDLLSVAQILRSNPILRLIQSVHSLAYATICDMVFAHTGTR
jgi:hypothetical protein